MRIILVTGIVVLSFLMLLSFWFKFEPSPESNTAFAQEEIQQQIEEAEEVQEVPEIIARLNAKNSLIHNLYCQEVNVKTWEQGMRVRLSATLYYEKQKRFRIRLSTTFGIELDMGSNDEIFWYWSRRDNQPGLYWATYADYHKTRLKTPFNPVFMSDSLGLEEIDIENARISETPEYMMCIYNRYNSMGQPVLYSILVNKDSEEIDAIMVTDMDGFPLATADIQRYTNGLPKEILYTWHEEDRMLSLEFNQPQGNVSIPPAHWVPPDKTPKINMAEQ